MEYISEKIAQVLLDIGAVKLSPEKPFTWASGWKSPIYCDNRLILSYPQARNVVYQSLVKVISKKYPDVEVIVGVATGGIAIAVLASDMLELPFAYVRPQAKGHGLGNQVEGNIPKGAKVVVVEDLISTGGSSLNAVKALREHGANILGMVAIFSYNFNVATENFEKESCQLETLTSYPVLIEKAIELEIIPSSQKELLQTWRENPSEWAK